MSMDDGTTIPSLDFSMTFCRNEFQCDVNLTLILVFDMIGSQVDTVRYCFRIHTSCN